MKIDKNDIPLQVARSAYTWISQDPEKRGEGEQTEYVRVLAEFYNGLMIQAKNDAEREYLEAAAIRYKEGYILHKLDHLRAHSRCASVMVTGGSNFNVRRAEKANNSEHNKSLEFSDWRTRAESAILKGLKELRITAAGGPAVIMRQEIEAAEKEHEIFKAIRAEFRKESDPEKRRDILKRLTGLEGKELAGYVARNYIDADGLPVFRLTNNGARIKAMRERLAEMEKRDATPTTEKAFDGGRVVDNAEADRIQVFFNERPGPELYGKLKSRGFRWSPTAGAWQRYRTPDTRWAVEAITGVKI